ncbi:hypothetical protein ACFYTQ_03170 [Nocardia sp. NPDC004068]|uniref:ATP-dependent DNA ligase n=1 Tax=Nocardia sp. NPDC004068 TaxID=3364303 RepID=UPI0036C1BA82
MLPRYPPMLAAPGPIPSDEQHWAFEMRFDGIRAVAYVADTLLLLSRTGNNITSAWPELATLAPADPPYVVDGEIVAFVDGVPAAAPIQSRMHQRDPDEIAALAATAPAVFVAFDLLHLGDRTLIDLPYDRRRELLEQLAPDTPHWQISPRLTGPATELLAHSRELNLKGLIAKRLDAPYLPGRRTPLWTKIENLHTEPVVIVGWRPGPRPGRIGALLVATPTPDGRLIRIGTVETGFTRTALTDLHMRLVALQQDTPAVVNPGAGEEVVWVAPRLTAEVAFTDWTAEGMMRDPSWRGLRPEAHLDRPRR